MIEKVLEAFFRHMALLILPIIVLPAVASAAVLSTPPQYEAQAGIWIERATYLSYTSTLNPYLSPAQNQNSRLGELMATASFRAEVAGRTALAPITTVPAGVDALARLFARDFDASVSGDHLLVMRYRAEDRALALEVLQALIAAFKQRASTDRTVQGQVAIDFYGAQLAAAQARLSAAEQDRAAILLAHPDVAIAFAKTGVEAASRLSNSFADAQRRVETALSDSDSARSSLDRARLDISASVQADTLGFQIVDPPTVSATASRQLRKLLLYPVGALLAGVALSASLLLLFSLGDRSVRSLASLAPETVVLGVVPQLRPRGIARRSGSHLTRRAIGYLAGTIVPVRASSGRGG